MRTRIPVALGLVGLMLVLAACVSLKRTPEGRFFVLQAMVPPPPAGERLEAVAIVGVEPVRLPDFMDRPQLVTWTGSNELRVDEFLRWAEPLEAGIVRTVAVNLGGLLPEYRFVRRPWPGQVRTRCRVALTLREFGLHQDGTVRLTGRFALLPDDGELALAMQSVQLSEGPLPSGVDGAAPDPGVDAMSRLLEKLSRQVAVAIQALLAEEIVADLEEETVESESVE